MLFRIFQLNSAAYMLDLQTFGACSDRHDFGDSLFIKVSVLEVEVGDGVVVPRTRRLMTSPRKSLLLSLINPT
jgi:hypothetical protein